MVTTPSWSSPPAPRVRPSGWWYLLVAALWVVAIALVASVVVTGARVVNDGVTPVPTSRVVDVPADGLTIYTRHDVGNPDCAATAPDGRTVHLNDFGFNLNATIDGNDVYAIASTPSGLSGLHRIDCQGVARNEPLWTGDRLPIGSIAIRAVVAVGCFLIGLVVLIVLLVRRSSSKRRIRQLGMSGGYGGGWPGQPPYGGPPPPSPWTGPPTYQPPPPPGEPPSESRPPS